MPHKLFLLFFWTTSFLLIHTKTDAQPISDVDRKPRILILLDGSSSMMENWSDKEKRFQKAREIIFRLMDSLYLVNPDVEFALRVFGHQYGVPENNCTDTKREVGFGKQNLMQINRRLNDIQPYGVSPIAYALSEAATYDMVNESKYLYSLILITDGGESCGGNLCDVVKNIINKKIFFRPYIVSLLDYEPLKSQYDCLGTYLLADQPKNVDNAIHKIVEAHTEVLTLAKNNPKLLRNRLPEISIPTKKPNTQNTNTTPAKPQVLNLSALKKFNNPFQNFVVRYPDINTSTRKTPASTYPLLNPEWYPKEVAQKLVSQLAFLTRPDDNSRRYLVQYPTVKSEIRKFPANVFPLLNPDWYPEEVVKKPIVDIASIAQRNAPSKTYPVKHSNLSSASRKIPSNVFPLLNPDWYPEEVIKKPIVNITSIAQRSSSSKTYPVKHSNLSSASRKIPSNVFPLLNPDWYPEEVVIQKRNPVALSELKSNFKIRKNPVLYFASNSKPISKKVKGPFLKQEWYAGPEFGPTAIAKVPPPKLKPTPKPKPPVQKTPTPYTKEVIKTEETLFKLYFSDGKNKYYRSEPEVVVTDAKTGKVVTTFYRTVNRGNGEPDPKKISPGIYNLRVGGKEGSFIKNIEIVEHTTTKLVFIVNHGTLKFQWKYYPEKPMTDYFAIVNRRFDPAPTIKQKCTAELEYEAGTYYVEVSTLPVHKAAFDINFGTQAIITVPEPGTVKFTNTNPVGRVALLMQLGDKFAQFYEVTLNGNPDLQELNLQPGHYEAHFVKDPRTPYSSIKKVKFRVQSFKTVEVLLQ